MRKVKPYEMVVLRKPSSLVPLGTRWKVTARYEVSLSASKRLKCVRLHGFIGGGRVLVSHYSEAEFSRLFRPAPES